MKRARANRRKTAPRRMPTLPKVEISINWRALLVPPMVVVVLVAAAMGARTLLDRPVGSLIIEGRFQRVTPVQIEAALDPVMRQSFLTLDLDSLRASVAAIDWIDTVRINRQWPSALKVQITEHQAAASWGDNGLLNTRGDLFTEDARYEYAELPKLRGPDGSERRVATMYLDVKGRLADANLVLTSLRMDSRGSVEIALASGQVIRLGKRDVNTRLDRFFRVVAPALEQDFNRVDYLDLRYPNGFAVGWHESKSESATRLAEVDSRG